MSVYFGGGAHSAPSGAGGISPMTSGGSGTRRVNAMRPPSGDHAKLPGGMA